MQLKSCAANIYFHFCFQTTCRNLRCLQPSGSTSTRTMSHGTSIRSRPTAARAPAALSAGRMLRLCSTLVSGTPAQLEAAGSICLGVLAAPQSFPRPTRTPPPRQRPVLQVNISEFVKRSQGRVIAVLRGGDVQVIEPPMGPIVEEPCSAS